MRFLVIEHLAIEPPALIGAHLAAQGHALATCRRWQGEPLPDAREYDALVLMGGPQSANDETPMIQEELGWLESAIAAGAPMLGICLGAQLMARAAGGSIAASPVRELGWYPVWPTQAAAADPLFRHLSPARRVFQWHGETFSLPDGAIWLAQHPEVPHQAFRLNEGQYGLQFHLEADAELIEQWIESGESERQALGVEGLARIRRDHARWMPETHALCRTMLDAWLGVLGDKKQGAA